MAVSRRAVTSGQATGVSGAATFNITKPTGTVDGDLMRVGICSDGSATGGTVTAPSGWTEIGGSPVHPTHDGQWLHVWEKIASGEGASWSWTVNVSTGNDVTWGCITHTGQDSTYQDVAPVTTNNSGSNASVVSVSLSGVNTLNDNCMIVWMGIGDPDTSNSGTFTEPASFTAGVNLYSNFAPLVICDWIQSTHGNTGSLAGSLTFASGAAGFGGMVIAIRPLAGAAALDDYGWSPTEPQGTQTVVSVW